MFFSCSVSLVIVPIKHLCSFHSVWWTLIPVIPDKATRPTCNKLLKSTYQRFVCSCTDSTKYGSQHRLPSIATCCCIDTASYSQIDCWASIPVAELILRISDRYSLLSASLVHFASAITAFCFVLPSSESAHLLLLNVLLLDYLRLFANYLQIILRLFACLCRSFVDNFQVI